MRVGWAPVSLGLCPLARPHHSRACWFVSFVFHQEPDWSGRFAHASQWEVRERAGSQECWPECEHGG